MKDQLIFDTTDANTIADSDSVGAFVRGSDGTLITQTGGALDVNVAGGVNVEVDLSHIDDSIRLGDGTSFFTSTSENGDVALDVHLSNTSIAVTAAQLDIDDLNATDDAVQAWTFDGTGTAITSRAEGGGQAMDVHITGSDPLTISDAALANTAIASGATALSVANTAQDIVAAPLASRKYLSVYNNDNRKMYIGQSGVSASTGFPVSPGSYVELRCGASVDIEFVSAKATHDLRYLELS